MVSSTEESFSEETKSANSEDSASWQQDSDEEDLMSSEPFSRSTHKRKRTSSLPTSHKMNILAPAYPDVPVVNSSLYQNPWPWMCPPWMYAQQMPMSPPPWTTMGPQPAVMSYYAPWMQVSPPPPWTMGAPPAVMSYDTPWMQTPWMQVSPTPWDHLKDYGGHGPELKKAEKRVKASRHVKNVPIERKVKVRKVVKLKKNRGNHLSLTEKPERDFKHPSKHPSKHPKAMGKLKKSSEDMEGKLSKALANATAIDQGSCT